VTSDNVTTWESRLASTWVTPFAMIIEGLPEPDLPNGYAMTAVVGDLLLHGVRITTASPQLVAWAGSFGGWSRIDGGRS
jgi:hypothetical protein